MGMIKVATFNTRLEAETIGHVLDPHGIPFMIRGDNLRSLGSGLASSSGGASLWVPEEAEEEVTTLLANLNPPDSEES